MADGFLPDEGIGDQLRYLLSAEIPGVLPWELFLWVNDFEPDNTVTFGDLVEASFYGYHRVTLSRNNWSIPAVADGCATSYSGDDAITWTVDGGPTETVYGVAYLDRAAGVLRYCQRFDDDDIRTTGPGVKLRLLPQYTLTSAACGAARRARGSRAAERRKGKLR